MVNRKIFIVDNDPIFRAKLASHLDKTTKAEVYTFTSGEDCMRFIHNDPDLIIIDYHLDSQFNRVLSGIDILQKIAHDHPITKVIILSSNNSHDEDMIAAINGAFDYIPKTEGNLARIESTTENALKFNLLESNIKSYRNTLYLTLAGSFTGLIAVGTLFLAKTLGTGHLL